MKYILLLPILLATGSLCGITAVLMFYFLWFAGAVVFGFYGGLVIFLIGGEVAFNWFSETMSPILSVYRFDTSTHLIIIASISILFTAIGLLIENDW